MSRALFSMQQLTCERSKCLRLQTSPLCLWTEPLRSYIRPCWGTTSLKMWNGLHADHKEWNWKKENLTWRFLWNERPCPSQHSHLERALIEMSGNGFARLTAGKLMEMSANKLMWPFSGDMEVRRTWRPQVSDSLVCMTQDSHYKNNVSCLADVNVMMTSACSGERSGDRHWISDAEKVRQANGWR